MLASVPLVKKVHLKKMKTGAGDSGRNKLEEYGIAERFFKPG